MNRLKVLFFVCFVALLGCESKLKLPPAPKDLIPRDSMVSLLKDMAVLESYMQNRYQNVNAFYKVMSESGKYYLNSKNISEERFERSFTHYVSRQNELQSMYSEVIDSLTKEAN